MSLIDVKTAVERLRAGDVVAIPTETVYGLAGRIDREDTLTRIFTVKGRPFFDPLIVHVENLEQARALTREWPAIYDDLAGSFWPGPLTLIAPKAAHVSGRITSGLDTVAVRCPRHPQALEILRGLGIPLAAPSANRFGRTSPTQARDVETEFAGQVAVVDGGTSEVGVESTVIAAEPVSPNWRIKILRPGGVSRARMQAALASKGYTVEFVREQSTAAPGHLKAHYQPSNPVVIVQGQASDQDLTPRIAAALGLTPTRIRRLELASQPELAARMLYQEFRRLSETPGDVIVIQRLPEHATEDWDAVWDRIERASSLSLP